MSDSIVKKKILVMGWFSDFECPGGDCGLTCCSKEWDITLTDDEISHYQNMDSPFKDTILNAIDMDKKKFKCDSNTCNMLNKDGYCDIVLNCGAEHLSVVCETFPRASKEFGDITEVWVEIVCPVVARFLLDNHVIDFYIEDSDMDCVIDPKISFVYDTLCIARTNLVEIMQLIPGQFVYGKTYIMLNTIEQIQELIRSNSLTKENVQKIVSHFDDEEVFTSFLVKCEQLGTNIVSKSSIINNILTYFTASKHIMGYFLDSTTGRFNFIADYISKWLTNRQELEKSLSEYIPYFRDAYPLFYDNLFVYYMFTSWVNLNLEEFGQDIKNRIIEQLIMQIFAMAIYCEKGELSKDDFSVIISMVDRIFIHTNVISSIVAEEIKSFENENLSLILSLVI